MHKQKYRNRKKCRNCSSTNDSEAPCPFHEFIYENSCDTASSNEIGGTTNEAYNFFKASQVAISKKDYIKTIDSFNSYITLTKEFLLKMPSTTLCNPQNCEACTYFTWMINEEYLFIKTYMLLEKGYMQIKLNKYEEAQIYFKSIIDTQQQTAFKVSLPPSLEDKTNITQVYEKNLIANSYLFLGLCQTMLKNYNEALISFNNHEKIIGNIDWTVMQKSIYGYAPLSYLFPKNGLYKEFTSGVNSNVIFLPIQKMYFSGICYENTDQKGLALNYYKMLAVAENKNFEYYDDVLKRIAYLENSSVSRYKLEFKGKSIIEKAYINESNDFNKLDICELSLKILPGVDAGKEVKVNLSYKGDEAFESIDDLLDFNGYKITDLTSRYIDKERKIKNFGFVDDLGQLKETLTLTFKNSNEQKIYFKCSHYGGDTFTVNAQILGDNEIQSKVIQVWKKSHIHLYSMNIYENQNLFPVLSKNLTDYYEELFIKFDIYKHKEQIPAYYVIKSSKNIWNESILLYDWINLMSNKIVFSNERINIIGINKFIDDKDSDLNGFGMDIVTHEGIGQTFYTVLLSTGFTRYSEYASDYTNDGEQYILLHEIGHLLGLQHPLDDINEKGKYKHSSSCGMYSYKDHRNPRAYLYCKTCQKIIKNNFLER